jgi:FPC/CPF motif-containing protein YcgG
MAEAVHASLRALLHDADFPCVGAKSVVNQASYGFGLYHAMLEQGSTAGLAFDLAQYVADLPQIEGEFTSYIASFIEPKVRRPKDFESLLWRQLKALHLLDRPLHDWNPEVSADVNSPQFSFSFAASAFFVVGLSPSNPRWARHFPWPTLVFNDHFQFERLREEQRFDRIRDVIRERDRNLHGSENAMLSDHGSHSEASQYAGRHVTGDWHCPVSFEAGSATDTDAATSKTTQRTEQ